MKLQKQTLSVRGFDDVSSPVESIQEYMATIYSSMWIRHLFNVDSTRIKDKRVLGEPASLLPINGPAARTCCLARKGGPLHKKRKKQYLAHSIKDGLVYFSPTSPIGLAGRGELVPTPANARPLK